VMAKLKKVLNVGTNIYSMFNSTRSYVVNKLRDLLISNIS